MSALDLLLDGLEHTIASGSEQQRFTMLKRITDLFIAGASRYSDDQIELFDDVLMRLAAEIEEKARARLAERLAPIPNAPRNTIRSLAFDDAISVAEPVLIASAQLNDDDLIANARSKSQDHLYAITQRPTLSAAVTDVLVDRGDVRVVRAVTGNDGARFSDAGFGKLVARARIDDTLARHVGMRCDIPRHHFIKLLETASDVVRAKLIAANPEAAAAIQDTVGEVASDISSEFREGSWEHHSADAAVKRRTATRQLTEHDVHDCAQSQNLEKTAIAVAQLGQFPVELVERALIDEGSDMILVLIKAAGCSRATAKMVLLLDAADRGMSPPDLDRALENFDRLNTQTARSLVGFYKSRLKAHADVGRDTALGPLS
jgi:uncharacterized protein (DUF2336 family)